MVPFDELDSGRALRGCGTNSSKYQISIGTNVRVDARRVVRLGALRARKTRPRSVFSPESIAPNPRTGVGVRETEDI